jgi:hypothetical protein
MHKSNVSDLLEIRGFNHHKINQRLDLIKSKLAKSGIIISLKEERKLEKILNKIANDQADFEDINFCQELCKFSNDNQKNNCQENIGDEKILKLSNKIKDENQQIDSDEIAFKNNSEILRQSLSFNDSRPEIIKNTTVIFKNDNYFLSYQISKKDINKLSFRVKFNDNKCVISFDENNLKTTSNQEIKDSELYDEEFKIIMLQKLFEEFPETYRRLISAKEFIYFKHDQSSLDSNSSKRSQLQNIDILRFNAQLELVYNFEINDPKIINLINNSYKKITRDKFFSYNFFKKIDSARKPCIPEVGTDNIYNN